MALFWHWPAGLTAALMPIKRPSRRRSSGRPKPAYGYAMQIAGKGDDFIAGVKHHPADPVFASCARQGLQTAHIVAAKGWSGFDFHSGYPSCAIFQNDIHLLPGGCTPVEELRLNCAPSGQLPQLHEYEVLQNAPGQISLCLQTVKQSLFISYCSAVSSINSHYCRVSANTP